MQRFRLNARLFALIAMVAVLASALAPAAARMLADTLGDRILLAEICGVEPTSAAARAAIAPDSLQTDGDESAALASDCPYCATHAFAFALPAMPRTVAVIAVASDAPPLRFLRSHRPLFAWIPAAPRGPPFES